MKFKITNSALSTTSEKKQNRLTVLEPATTVTPKIGGVVLRIDDDSVIHRISSVSGVKLKKITGTTIQGTPGEISLVPFLSPPTNAADYEVWGLDFVGLTGLTAYVEYKGIVPLVQIGVVGDNGNRNPDDAGYTLSVSDWSAIKSRLSAIPKGRRSIGAYAWWRDISIYTKPYKDYYEATADGTSYDNQRFLTIWSDQNKTDSQASFSAFLTHARNSGISFDFVDDDREFSSIWHLDGSSTYSGFTGSTYSPENKFPANFGDARLLRAMVADPRFTAKASPVTGKPFAQEFIENYNTLAGTTLATNDWTELVRPFLGSSADSSGFPAGASGPAGICWGVSNAYKGSGLYWTPYYGSTARGPSGSGNARLTSEQNAGRVAPPYTISDAYSLFYKVVPAWNAVADNWHYNAYVKPSIRDALLAFPAYSGVTLCHYEQTPSPNTEVAFTQGSNMEPTFVTHNPAVFTGHSFYGAVYGMGNIIYPNGQNPGRTASSLPYYTAPINGSTRKTWLANHSYRSGYALSPQTDFEKYAWSGYLDPLYSPASAVAIQRYPKTAMIDSDNTSVFTGRIYGDKTMTVSGVSLGTITVGQELSGSGVADYEVITSQISGTTGGIGVYGVSLGVAMGSATVITGHGWYASNITPFYSEINFKLFVDAVKKMRHTHRSNVAYYKSFKPYMQTTLSTFLSNIAGNDYWYEQMFHVLLHGPQFLSLFEGDKVVSQSVLDVWRTISGNSKCIPCSNAAGSTAELVDRLHIENCFSGCVTSGGKLENSNRRIWRLTLAPEHFDDSETVVLKRTSSSAEDWDIPDYITINKNDDDPQRRRGVWITRNKPGRPEYTILDTFYDFSSMNVTVVNEPYSYSAGLDELLLSPPITGYNYNDSSRFRFYNSSATTPWLNLDGTSAAAAYTGASLAEYFAINQINTTSILKNLDLSCVPVPYYNNYVYLGEGPTGSRFGFDHFGNGVLITRKHLVDTGHGDYFPKIGQQLRFLNAKNEIKFATVAKRMYFHTLGDGSTEDTSLIEFEEDVDSSIIPARILVQSTAIPAPISVGSVKTHVTPGFIVTPNQFMSIGYINSLTYLDPQRLTLSENAYTMTMSSGITDPLDARYKYRYYETGLTGGDSGSPVFIIYQNKQKTITIPCLLGNVITADAVYNDVASRLQKIQSQITAWGNTGDKYKLNILYNKYE